MAERVGFEPTAPCGVTGFQDQLLKPLGHLSITVLLYQIGLTIGNNVIVKQAKKLAHSQLFSCVFNASICTYGRHICSCSPVQLI